MRESINRIFDAADSIGAKITKIESNDTYSIVELEKDYVSFRRVVDHKYDFTKITEDFNYQFITARAIILAKP